MYNREMGNLLETVRTVRSVEFGVESGEWSCGMFTSCETIGLLYYQTVLIRELPIFRKQIIVYMRIAATTE